LYFSFQIDIEVIGYSPTAKTLTLTMNEVASTTSFPLSTDVVVCGHFCRSTADVSIADGVESEKNSTSPGPKVLLKSRKPVLDVGAPILMPLMSLPELSFGAFRVVLLVVKCVAEVFTEVARPRWYNRTPSIKSISLAPAPLSNGP
jgi:hypothetical protein